MNYSISATLYKTLNTKNNPDKVSELETVKTLSFNYISGDKTTTSTALQLKEIIKEQLNVPANAIIKFKGLKELVDTDIVTDYNVYYTATIPVEVVVENPKKFSKPTV